MAPVRLSDQVGRVVSGRYRIVAPLGSGASAQVFLADDVRLERQVAIKMLQPTLADDERFLRRFRAEARTVAAISHPNVVVVHDWGEEEVPYLVTEYLAGGSLRAMLNAEHRLSPSQALLVGLDVCRGLAYAHGAGLVHRDLKPANILFDTEGRLRIADFGLARAIAEAAITEPEGAMVGTVRYSAPEQARGERLDGKADIYALALVLVEAVTGTVPFTADTTIGTLMARIDRDLDVPEDLGPLRSVVQRAGRLHAEDRPDAEELGILLLAASERMNAPKPLPLVGALEEARRGDEPGELTRTDMVPLPLDDVTLVTGAAAVPPPPRTAPAQPAVVAAARGDVTGDGGDAGPSHRRRRWPLVLAAALLVALGAGIYFGVDQLRTPSYEIPEVAGQQIDDLRLIAAQNDWQLDEKRARQNDTEPGEILSTDPAAGVELEEGETLVVVVSEGNELTSRPATLQGVPLEEAILELERAGLAHAVAREVFHEEIPAGAVVGFAEDVAEELPEGTEVPLVVSQGPEPRIVPDYPDGAGYEHVAGKLEAIGLVPVRADAFSDTFPKGHVISVSPEPGAEVPRDSEVTVTVSKGQDLVRVPDVRGMTLDEAEAELERNGLVLGQGCCNNKGKIVGTTPAHGERVRRGTEVDYLVSR